jgi:hypothetical protein
MSDKAYCHRCGKDLSKVEEIHASEGMMFCSDACAIDHYIDEIIMNAKEQAKKLYDEYAETITPADIGLV